MRTLIIVLILALSFGSVQAHKGTETPGRLPLYEDSLTHWKIWKGFDGYSRVRNYSMLVDACRDLGYEPPTGMVNENEKYLYENAPGLWYVFSLVIPEKVVTFWNATSELTLTYRSGKDTLRATSNLIFFSDAARKRLYFTYAYQFSGDFPVPNVLPLYKPEVPLVYARFDFKKTPDYLLSCTPSRVRSAFKEVRRR